MWKKKKTRKNYNVSFYLLTLYIIKKIAQQFRIDCSNKFVITSKAEINKKIT